MNEESEGPILWWGTEARTLGPMYAMHRDALLQQYERDSWKLVVTPWLNVTDRLAIAKKGTLP